MLEPLTVHLVHEGADWIAVNKPIGMDVFQSIYHTSGYPRLVDVVGKNRPYARVVNRIDRDASGIVLFSMNKTRGSWFAGVWQNESTDRRKIYTARIDHEPKWVEVENRTWMKNQKGTLVPATTVFRRSGLDVEAELLAHGRTHQIRKHLMQLGTPILGDKLYGGEPADRMYLHATSMWLNLDQEGGIWAHSTPPWFGEETFSMEQWIADPLTPEQYEAAKEEASRPKRKGRKNQSRPDGMPWDEWMASRDERELRSS